MLNKEKIRKMISGFVTMMLFSGIAGAAEYYVSQTGSDFDTGTLELPFATIQQAADVMQAGDVCYIRGGVYRESVRIQITGGASFTAYNVEVVDKTDLHLVVKCQPVGDGIYRTPADDEVTQVFVDWERMDIARFPNLDGADLLAPPLLSADEATGVESPGLSTITDDGIIQSSGFWTGARLWLLGGDKWVAWSATVDDHSGNTLSFDWPGGTGYAYIPEEGSSFFLYGTLDALDTEREWYYDADERMLYLMAPGGVDPSSLDVGVRVRRNVVDLNGAKNIELSGLTFFAGSVSFDGAENCVLENSLVFYPVPFFHASGWNLSDGVGIDLAGSGNTVRDCEVAYSWGDGVSVSGADNTVENCLIHDTDWSGNDNACINTGGSGHTILGNSTYNTGRSAILHRNTSTIRIEKNDIYNFGCLTHDLGATYCFTTDGNGSTIAYNMVHDPYHNERGIYLDNNSSEFTVHHNVVWNCRVGIQTNMDAIGHRIYHNTIWNCDNVMTKWGPDGTAIYDQLVYNNIADVNNWIGTDIRRNLTVTSADFADADGGDFRLTSDSIARDDYYTLAGLINGGFEDERDGWTVTGGAVFTNKTDYVHSGEQSGKVIWRDDHADGISQPITDVFLDNGMGQYTFEAWALCEADDVPLMLKINFVDDTDQDYQYQAVEQSIAGEWVKLTVEADMTWSGTVQEADFIIMTTEDDTDTESFYVDDCSITTPLGGGIVGAVILSGINDSVADGKPDAGAFEYGEDWDAGSSLQQADIPHPVDNYVQYLSLEAELFDEMSGVAIRDGVIAGCDSGDWVMFRGIDFGNGYAAVRVRYAAAGTGGGLEIRSNDPETGTLLAELALADTGDSTVFDDQTADLSGAAGVNDLYMVFTGGSNVGLFDRFRFEDGSGGGSAPAAPDSIRADTVTTSTATIYWSDVDNETGYILERRQGSGNYTKIADIARNTTMYEDSGLMSGAGFSYRVRAVNVDGKSGYSDEAAIETESDMSGGLLIEAESFDEMEGIIDGGTGIGGCDNNDWVKYSAVDLGDGYNTIRMRVAVPDQYGGQTVEIRSGDPDTGILLGELVVEATGGWGEYTEQRTMLTGASGVMDIYIVFVGSSGVGNFDWFNFEDPVTAVEEADIPSTFNLGQNYPNPFNPVTRISYQLPETAHVRLDIYDVLGRKVRTLVDAHCQPGYFTAVWDGRDSRGVSVSSGVYLYRISMRGTSQDYVYSRKMLLMH